MLNSLCIICSWACLSEKSQSSVFQKGKIIKPLKISTDHYRAVIAAKKSATLKKSADIANFDWAGKKSGETVHFGSSAFPFTWASLITRVQLSTEFLNNVLYHISTL